MHPPKSGLGNLGCTKALRDLANLAKSDVLKDLKIAHLYFRILHFCWHYNGPYSVEVTLQCHWFYRWQIMSGLMSGDARQRHWGVYLAAYSWTLHCCCHCQFPVSFDHSQATCCSCHCQVPVSFDHSHATRCPFTEGSLESGWPALAFRHAAGGWRHCQDSDMFSDNSSCHCQEAGRPSLQCQVTPFCAVSKDRRLQCQHQLFETFPDSFSQSQRYRFRQLLSFFQSLFSKAEPSVSLFGPTALSGAPSTLPSGSLRSATLPRWVWQPSTLWWGWFLWTWTFGLLESSAAVSFSWWWLCLRWWWRCLGASSWSSSVFACVGISSSFLHTSLGVSYLHSPQVLPQYTCFIAFST